MNRFQENCGNAWQALGDGQLVGYLCPRAPEASLEDQRGIVRRGDLAEHQEHLRYALKSKDSLNLHPAF